MIGYDFDYAYPVQMEIIHGRHSYISGWSSREDALRGARKRIENKHAGTILSGAECTVFLHTAYASYCVWRRPGHTDRDIEASG